MYKSIKEEFKVNFEKRQKKYKDKENVTTKEKKK
jgi:hypothetical protein